MIKFKHLGIAAIVVILMALSIYGSYELAFRNLIFPRISVSGIEVTGMDKVSALKLVSTYFKTQPTKIELQMNGKRISDLNDLKISHDLNWAVDQAYNVGRNGNILTQISEQIKSLTDRRNVDAPLNYSKDELIDTIDQIADETEQKPEWPRIDISGQNIKVIPGKDGIEIRKDELTKLVVDQMALPGKHTIEIPLNKVDTQASQVLSDKAITALKNWGSNSPTLKFRDFEKHFKLDDLAKLYGLISDPINQDEFENLVNEIKPNVETDPKDAVFVFEDSKVKEFKPEVVGATIDTLAFRQKLENWLLAGVNVPLDIPVILSYPKVKTGDINNLGIKELIGTGKSTFFHSIPGRVFNVNLAASRVNGTLVAPGEEFSFNNAVGEISKATGYQQAYIISEGRTVLGDGGGVCQVSTTTFRAALDAGLPITERKAHAYRVGYYEQDSGPGIDATVFSPSADLKFLNDTGHYILIQETVDVKNYSMKVDIYGTSDGRKAIVSKPRVSNQVPPPPTLYVDDPTLPLGAMKQVDWSAWGAKVAFDYKVTDKNGNTTIDKTFYSNYQPWQAIYMKGTGDLATR